VFLAYATSKGRTLIDRELYLPKSWTADRDRCRAADVPDTVEFATKTVLAQAMLARALAAGVPAAWVSADEAYGQDPNRAPSATARVGWRSISSCTSSETAAVARGSVCTSGALQEQLDTGTSGGKLVFHVFGALAEFERDLIRERTMAGLATARARGRRGDRRGLSAEKVRQLRTVRGICRTLGISRATFYRYVKDA
jgi:hypothetical protein